MNNWTYNSCELLTSRLAISGELAVDPEKSIADEILSNQCKNPEATWGFQVTTYLLIACLKCIVLKNARSVLKSNKCLFAWITRWDENRKQSIMFAQTNLKRNCKFNFCAHYHFSSDLIEVVQLKWTYIRDILWMTKDLAGSESVCIWNDHVRFLYSRYTYSNHESVRVYWLILSARLLSNPQDHILQ